MGNGASTWRGRVQTTSKRVGPRNSKRRNTKMAYDRVVPYFLSAILPRVLEGKNVLVVGHGNSLRTLIKYIEDISDEAIADVEMPFESVLFMNFQTKPYEAQRGSRGRAYRSNAFDSSGIKLQRLNSIFFVRGTEKDDLAPAWCRSS